MSSVVVSRILRHSRASDAARRTLVVIGYEADGDGVLGNGAFDIAGFAALVGVHPRTVKRALKALAEAGEIFYLRGDGRGTRSVFGVLVGLSDEEKAELEQRVVNRAIALGGGAFYRLVQADDETPKGWHHVTLSRPERVAPRPERVTPRHPLAGVSPLSVFKQQQQGDGPDGPEGNADAPPPPVAPDGQLTLEQGANRDALVGLGVFDYVADWTVTNRDADFTERLIAVGRELKRRGRTPALGGLLGKIAKGALPMPVLTAPPASPPPAPALDDGRTDSPPRSSAMDADARRALMHQLWAEASGTSVESVAALAAIHAAGTGGRPPAPAERSTEAPCP